MPRNFEYDSKGRKVHTRQEPTSPPGELDAPYDTWLFGNKGPALAKSDNSDGWLFSGRSKPGARTHAERRAERNPTWVDRLKARFPRSPRWKS